MQKVILADNQAIFRAGAARILAQEPDVRIVAQVADLPRLLSSIESFRGSAVIFSLGLKPELPAVLVLLKEADSVGILVVDKGDTIPEPIAAQLSGILGRGVTAAELTDCIRRVSRGHRCVPMTNVACIQAQDIVGARVRDRLTPKELQIVALIVQGCKNKEIATQLGTKEQVIKNYLRSIYDKSGVSDRLELALFTLHHKMLAEAAARVGALLERRSA